MALENFTSTFLPLQLLCKSIIFHLLVLHFLYGFFGSLNVVLFHKCVHRGQFDLSTKVRIDTAVGHCGILEILGRITQLIMRNGKKSVNTKKNSRNELDF